MTQITSFLPSTPDEAIFITMLDRQSFIAFSETCTQWNSLLKSIPLHLTIICSDPSVPQFIFKRHIFIVDSVCHNATIGILHEAQIALNSSPMQLDVMPYFKILKENWIRLGISSNHPLYSDYISEYRQGAIQLATSEALNLGALQFLADALEGVTKQDAAIDMANLPTESITPEKYKQHMQLMREAFGPFSYCEQRMLRQALLEKHAEGFKKLSEVYLNADSAKPHIAVFKEQIKIKLESEKLRCLCKIEQLNDPKIQEKYPPSAKKALRKGTHLIQQWTGDDQILEAAAKAEAERIGHFYQELSIPVTEENEEERGEAFIFMNCCAQWRHGANTNMIPPEPLTRDFMGHFFIAREELEYIPGL